MTVMALECSCILIESPWNLAVLLGRVEKMCSINVFMLSSVSDWACPPETIPVVGAGIFFNWEIRSMTSVSLGRTLVSAPSALNKTILN